MSKLALRIFILYSIIFTSQKFLDVFLGGLSSPIKLLLIFILWAVVFGLYWEKLTSKERSVADVCLVLLLFLLISAASISLLVHQIPIIIVTYVAISYLSFYPLIYLIIYLKRNPKFFYKLLSFSVALYIFISVGIVFDSYGVLTKLPILGQRITALEEQSEKSEVYLYRGDQRRGSFFMESSTIVFPVLSSGFLTLTMLNSLFVNKKTQLFKNVWLNSAIIWLACFFSLSRTPLYLISVMIFYLLAKTVQIGTTKNLLRQITFAILLVTLIVASTQVQSALYQQLDQSAVDAFNSGISSEEGGNQKRFLAWAEGLQLFTDSESWLGYGLGTSRVGLDEYLGRQARYHYESSLLSSFSEAGIFGILIETLPLLVVIYIVVKYRINSLFLVWALLFVINIFAAPITAYSTMFCRYLGMGLCIAYIVPYRQQPKQPRIIYQQQ